MRNEPNQRAPLRIGVLGAARITPSALLEPARKHAEVDVVAVAARDRDRALAYADEHSIGRVHGSYEALLADPDVDAVYVPVPNALHGRWTIAAVEAGKHVLCEKPFAANADEAAAVHAAVSGSGRVVMEAFHYVHHPLIAHVRRLVDQGAIGDLVDVRAYFNWPIRDRADIRYDAALAGGALMDLGCYAVHFVRTIVGAEPSVESARAREWSGIDESMRAGLSFPNGVTGGIACSFRSPRVLPGATISGTRGAIRIHNFVAPQARHWITVRTGRRRRRSAMALTPTTYDCQLDVFADAVLRGTPFPTTSTDAVATMRVIDDIYRTAGLEPRQPA